MKYRMRMLAVHRRQLCELLADTSREQGCFLICKHAQGNDETVLLVHKVCPLLAGDFIIQKHNQLSVDPSAMLRVAREAQKLGGSVCMVHTHPMSHGAVAFSEADDIGNADTFAFFTRMLPNQPNSCLVWDAELEHVEGRVYTTDIAWELIDQVEVVSGEQRLVYTSVSQGVGTQTQFDRQARLLGAEGQSALKKLHIGIVGCGGIGSIAASLLAHSGVSQITLVDFDSVEQSNLPRILGSIPDDARLAVSKIEVAKRYICAHAPDAIVQTSLLAVEDATLLPYLVTLDLIICGTDDTTSRAFLNQLCHQYYIPILDLGVQFAANPSTEKLVKEIGRVHLMLPSSACMLCTGDVNPKVLSAEGLSKDEFQHRLAEGYVAESDIKQPAMMVFNMQVAARGMQHLISWVTGLSPIEEGQYEQFRFLGLTAPTGIKAIRKSQVEDCYICLPNSSFIGAGNSQPMLVQPRLR